MKPSRHPTSVSRIAVGGDGPPVEADAACAACGARGTIGRATRVDAGGAPLEVHRFCASCWPARSAELERRWAADGGGFHFSSATWDTSLFLVRSLRGRAAGGEALSEEYLARWADWMRSLAPGIVVPMPPEVEEFLRRHGDRAG